MTPRSESLADQMGTEEFGAKTVNVERRAEMDVIR